MGHGIMRDSLSEIMEILEMIIIWHHKPPRLEKLFTVPNASLLLTSIPVSPSLFSESWGKLDL